MGVCIWGNVQKKSQEIHLCSLGCSVDTTQMHYAIHQQLPPHLDACIHAFIQQWSSLLPLMAPIFKVHLLKD